MSELGKVIEQLERLREAAEKAAVEAAINQCDTTNRAARSAGAFSELLHTHANTLIAAAKRAEQAEAEVGRLREALEKYADRENWGYYDESGCPKGIGRDTDACFIGPEVAEAALTPPPTANEGATA